MIADIPAEWLNGERLPHAILLEGAPAHALELARRIAQAAVCKGAAGAARPCHTCAACIKAAAQSHPDIEVLGGDGSYQSVKVDTIRTLREGAYILPNESPKRAVILTGAEGMTTQAQNALLKLLEEPPAHLVLLLTCATRAGLLPTIISRLQTLRLPEAADMAASEQVQTTTKALAIALASGVEWELMCACGALEKDKLLTDAVLAALRVTLRDALAEPAVSPEATALAAIDPATLLRWVHVLEDLQTARRRNVHQGLLSALLHSRLMAVM